MNEIKVEWNKRKGGGSMKYTIKELRARNKMTQEKLAELVGVSVQAVHAWEKNSNIIKLGNASRIAEVLNVKIDDIFIN